MLAATSTLAGAASSKASAATISARLTKTSFTSSQASSVQLIYRFSSPSKSFSYLLTFKKGFKWQTVKSVKKRGTFKGSHKMTAKKLFAGKPTTIGSYRLKLSADGGSKQLNFKIFKTPSSGGPTSPTGSAPTNALTPSISGITTQGQPLTAATGSWDNAPTSYAYQWRRCDGSGANCANISSASSSSYTLVFADAGSTIRVAVTASNRSGSSSPATSAQTAVVAGLPPVNASLPTVSGPAAQGQTLTALSGSWSNPPTSYAYQWRRCDSSGANCVDISSATSSTYLLVLADVGSTIRIVVTASNGYGSSSPATSGQTAVVVASEG